MSIIRYKTTNTIINMEQEYKDFIALVKRMRKAQEREAMLSFEEDEEFVTMICVEARKAERKVDEYLMKMEV